MNNTLGILTAFAMLTACGTDTAHPPPAPPATPTLTFGQPATSTYAEPEQQPEEPADTRMTYEAFKQQYLASGRPYAAADWTPSVGDRVLACDTSLEHWVSYTVRQVEPGEVYVTTYNNIDVVRPFRDTRVVPHPERTDTEMPAVGSYVLTAPENGSRLWCPARVTEVEGQNVNVELIHCQRGADPQEPLTRLIRAGEFALVK